MVIIVNGGGGGKKKKKKKEEEKKRRKKSNKIIIRLEWCPHIPDTKRNSSLPVEVKDEWSIKLPTTFRAN